MRKTLLASALMLAFGGPALAADLLDVYQRAQVADPQIAAAAAQHGAALQARPLARSNLMPKLSAGALYSQASTDTDGSAVPIAQRGSVDTDTTEYNLSLIQPLYHQDYFVQLSQADARIAQADANYTAAQQDLIVRAASAYFGVLAAEDNLRFAEAQRTAFEQQLRQTRQRFEVGLTAITDVREAQARYDLATAQEITARNQLDTANEQLRELTGEDYESLAKLGEVPLVVPEPANMDTWVNKALEQNLQLIAAEAASRFQREEIRRQRAQRYPTLDLTARVGSTERDTGLVTEQDSTVVGINLNFPFYQGGLISARTRESEFLYQQALAQLDQQRRATVRQTRDAFNGVQAGISQVEALHQAVISAQTALDATQAGYEVGTRTAVDVLDAQQQLYQAQSDYASARYNYVLATLQLKQAAGTLTPDDVRLINAWLTAGTAPQP
ncbi:MAG: TolC family outer membrane protein [Gammaproteobacteria bacterium]|nr:TolC family outer membrane protein [Gammaproteobacteria bacterium]